MVLNDYAKDRILGETGITEYEEDRYDVAFSILRDYYKTETVKKLFL